MKLNNAAISRKIIEKKIIFFSMIFFCFDIAIKLTTLLKKCFSFIYIYEYYTSITNCYKLISENFKNDIVQNNYIMYNINSTYVENN